MTSATARAPVARAIVAAGVAAGVDAALRSRIRRNPRWVRRNFRDREVVLSGGPAVAAGALVALAAPPCAPALVAGGTAAALGLYDDLYGDRHARGLRGHLAALRAGRVTTGLVKLVGLVAGGYAAGLLAGRRPGPAAVDAALVAGTANLVNLLDLRPGRALKAVAVAGSVGTGRPATSVGAAAAGAALALLPADLGEAVMIGDCGANSLGALLGWRLAASRSDRTRGLALAVVTGLTLASERVSFTEVIARTPWLRAVDAWGRR